MINIKPEFLDIEGMLGPIFKELLNDIPHELFDNYGKIISSNLVNQRLSEAVPLYIDHIATIASIRLPQEYSHLTEILELMAQRELEHAIESNQNLKTQILSQDLEASFLISNMEEKSFSEKIDSYLKLIRTHLLVDKISIHGITQGFTIEKIAQYPADSKCDHSAISNAVASSDTPHENLGVFCVPLKNGAQKIGSLYLEKKEENTSFSDYEKKIVLRISHLGSHILQKELARRSLADATKTSIHLGKYLSSKVVKKVKSNENIELGGVEKKVVCLFSDIRSFTKITENIPAPILVQLLNFYFERMSPIIDKYEGTLDKIVGDLIMAVWNIPHDQPEPELLAMKCALEMQKEMIRSVTKEWAQHGVPKVGMGIGLNAGPAVVGNLGSSSFMNYTAVGDTINTAQRLEASAAAGEIWMAESMFAAVDGKIERPLRKESAIKLKGKEITINAYVYRPLQF